MVDGPINYGEYCVYCSVDEHVGIVKKSDWERRYAELQQYNDRVH